MAIYIDNSGTPYKSMKMYRVAADTTKELFALADTLKLSRYYIKDRFGNSQHIEIAEFRREQVLALGAIEVTQEDLDLAFKHREYFKPLFHFKEQSNE